MGASLTQIRDAWSNGTSPGPHTLAFGRLHLADLHLETDFRFNAHNGLVDVDARLSLNAIRRQLEAQGLTLPLPRPLPAGPLWRVAIAAPFVVDALVHSGDLVTTEGALLQTPSAPRHAAGPSLLHLVAGPSPLALLVRARLRTVPLPTLRREDHIFDDVDGNAEALRALVNTHQGVAAIARGRTLSVWWSRPPTSSPTTTHGSPSASPSTSPSTFVAETPQSHRHLQSIAAADLVAIRDALLQGDAVVAVMPMQRLAVLRRVASDTDEATLVRPAAAAAELATSMRRRATAEGISTSVAAASDQRPRMTGRAP